VADRRSDRYLSIPIDRSAWIPLLLSTGLLVTAIILQWRIVAVVLAVLTALLVLFFRDPERRISADARAFVSPADGVVTAVGVNEDPEKAPVGCPFITIFLAVWNVHVNRVPHHGSVERVVYEPGGHAMALGDSAALNESNWIWFRAGDQRFVVRQVAGKIARHIVCRLRPGDWVRQGQRFGMIRFGSRTDLYLPAGSNVLVHRGDKVRGGTSVIALAPGIAIEGRQ
jgi:phosphatidylserine decarboxylase